MREKGREKGNKKKVSFFIGAISFHSVITNERKGKGKRKQKKVSFFIGAISFHSVITNERKTITNKHREKARERKNMKAATKKKLTRLVPIQAMLVGAIVEIDWLLDQWEIVRALVSSTLRAIGNLN